MPTLEEVTRTLVVKRKAAQHSPAMRGLRRAPRQRALGEAARSLEEHQDCLVGLLLRSLCNHHAYLVENLQNKLRPWTAHFHAATAIAAADKLSNWWKVSVMKFVR